MTDQNLGDDELKYFAGMPGAASLYTSVKNRILGRFPEAGVKVGKSQISFVSGRSFAYIWLPVRRVKNRPEVYIILTFGLGYRVQSPRITESVEPYPNRWTHHLVISSPADIDNEVLEWLQQAYAFRKGISGRRKHPPGPPERFTQTELLPGG